MFHATQCTNGVMGFASGSSQMTRYDFACGTACQRSDGDTPSKYSLTFVGMRSVASKVAEVISIFAPDFGCDRCRASGTPTPFEVCDFIASAGADAVASGACCA